MIHKNYPVKDCKHKTQTSLDEKGAGARWVEDGEITVFLKIRNLRGESFNFGTFQVWNKYQISKTLWKLVQG